MIIPKPLALGDRVAVIAPSSPVPREIADICERRIAALGFTPVMYPSCYMQYGHLSGQDSDRANDVNSAFRDSSIKGIICLGGGYGTPRILPLLDYEMISANPKPFLGYSDITGIHTALNTICRMVTYHGPMATTEFIRFEVNGISRDNYSTHSLLQNLTSTDPIGEHRNHDGSPVVSLYPGVAKGELIGGNLSLLVATLGSPYGINNAKGKILFIEDVGEAVYRVDRMLTSLLLAGVLSDCAGFIIGTWTGCTSEDKGYDQFSDLSLEQVISDIILPLKKPTVSNFLAGHIPIQPTLPLGRTVLLDSDSGTVTFL